LKPKYKKLNIAAKTQITLCKQALRLQKETEQQKDGGGRTAD
jgi:hypothetical protein